MSDTRRHVQPGVREHHLENLANYVDDGDHWSTYRDHLAALAALAVTVKSFERDRPPVGRRGPRRFIHEIRNDRYSLAAKVDGLRLAESLDKERAPRNRKNHKRPVARDDGKAWARMIKHDEAVAWCKRAGQHHLPGGGGAFGEEKTT
jgi:hypothetical protein